MFSDMHLFPGTDYILKPLVVSDYLNKINKILDIRYSSKLAYLAINSSEARVILSWHKLRSH